MRILSDYDDTQFSQLLSLAGGDIEIVEKALKEEQIAAQKEGKDMEIKSVINRILDLVDDVCWLCDQDNQIQAEIDGQMGG